LVDIARSLVEKYGSKRRAATSALLPLSETFLLDPEGGYLQRAAHRHPRPRHVEQRTKLIPIAHP